jgi:cytochrome c5
LKGKGAMPPQAGGDFDETEIARGVVYLANAAGAKFAEPKAPTPASTAAAPASAAVQTAAAPAPAATSAATNAAPAPAAAAPPAPAPGAAGAAPQAASGGSGEALYKQACFVCHAAGVAGAPKLGDKAAWAPRLQQGVPALVQSAMKGKGAMPPKGGSNASEQELRAAVEYMVNATK